MILTCWSSSSPYLLSNLSCLPRASTTTRRHARTLLATVDSLDLSTPSQVPKSHPFPFPRHLRPTPYEIFHLPINASSTDIKSRYYDLVRYHHPDSPYARSHTPCPNERNVRFQTILSAYGTLQNPTRKAWGYGNGPSLDPYMTEISRRRRASQNAEYLKRRRRNMDNEERRREQDDWQESGGSVRDGMMITLAVVALLGGLYPSFFLHPFHMEKTHQAAVANLTKARKEAQEVGHLRREEVRKRVRDIKASNKSDTD